MNNRTCEIVGKKCFCSLPMRDAIALMKSFSDDSSSTSVIWVAQVASQSCCHIFLCTRQSLPDAGSCLCILITDVILQISNTRNIAIDYIG